MERGRQLLAWVWTAIVGAASVGVLLAAIPHFGSSPRITPIALGFWGPALFTALGTLIATRRPGNRIAWLLLVIGTAILVEFSLQIYAMVEPVSPTVRDYVAIVALNSSAMWMLYFLALVPLLFPTGRYHAPRHRWIGRAGAATVALLLAMTILTEEIGPPFPVEEQAWTIANPAGFLPGSVLDVVIRATGAIILGMTVGGIVTLITRYRQASHVERAQIRWMLFATLTVALVFLVLLVTGASQSIVGGLLLLTAFAILPGSITVAITRYRLFEIDRIISRSITYALVVGLLGFLFAVGAIWLPAALSLTEKPLVVAGSTLAVAALFNPLRRRIQRGVDRRFNRSRYQADIVSESFAARLQHPHSVEDLAEVWRQTVNESLSPETSGVWLNPDVTQIPHD